MNDNHSIQTTDIFKGAVLMSCGGQLDKASLQGERLVCFVFTGKDLKQKDLDYRLGKALVNPLHLKEYLEVLRDTVSETIRTQKNRNQTRKGNHENDFGNRYPHP